MSVYHRDASIGCVHSAYNDAGFPPRDATGKLMTLAAYDQRVSLHALKLPYVFRCN
jgi:predicted NodU family carbamoyl transferase